MSSVLKKEGYPGRENQNDLGEDNKLMSFLQPISNLDTNFIILKFVDNLEIFRAMLDFLNTLQSDID